MKIIGIGAVIYSCTLNGNNIANITCFPYSIEEINLKMFLDQMQCRDMFIKHMVI